MVRWFVCACLTLFCCSSATAEDARRNVLFIISDDLNNLLGCYGDPQVKTPNIDRLATRGVMFNKAYCSFPLCGPSRNSLLTGLYPNSTGIHANAQIFRQTIPNQLSMPQAFRQQGYFAARIGKLYHYNVPNSVGTNGHDDPGSWEMELNPAGVDRLEEHPHIFSLTKNQFGGTLSWYASPKSDEHHTDAMMAKDADWVLERCGREEHRPFFLAVGFFRPHTPYVAPKAPYFDMYKESEMPVVQGIEEDQADIPAAGLGSHKKEHDKLTDDLRRQCRQAYYASISFMDTQVGVVVDSLERHGLADNTVIVFTSDHGYHMGEHGLWQKMSLFEESSRVPMLIVAPGMSKGRIAEFPVSQVDLFPTLAELCGVKTPGNLQGQSLVPMLKDPSHVGRGWALTQVTRGGQRRNAKNGEEVNGRFFGYSLRTPRWRYTEWDAGDAGRELYDHNNDPRELTNLAENDHHRGTVEELSTSLKDAVASTLPSDGKIPELMPGTWAPLLVDP
ncbi:MAG: sulfatase [Planctomycetota bacterium]|nr:sulfatase [Planctomycetota bacterium]